MPKRKRSRWGKQKPNLFNRSDGKTRNAIEYVENLFLPLEELKTREGKERYDKFLYIKNKALQKDTPDGMLNAVGYRANRKKADIFAWVK